MKKNTINLNHYEEDHYDRKQFLKDLRMISRLALLHGNFGSAIRAQELYGKCRGFFNTDSILKTEITSDENIKIFIKAIEAEISKIHEEEEGE